MSFRLFIYYCAAWGGCAAFFGWVLGRVLGGEPGLLDASVKGLALGLLVALGLGLVDALAAPRSATWSAVRHPPDPGPAHRRRRRAGRRLHRPALLRLSDGKWPSLLVSRLDPDRPAGRHGAIGLRFPRRLLRNEERSGARRKLRNGLIGGTVGGLAGGCLPVRGHVLGAVCSPIPAWTLWSPSATGFVALGACIGLVVGLAQVILKEAWVRVEAGFRPGPRADPDQAGDHHRPGRVVRHRPVRRPGRREAPRPASPARGPLPAGDAGTPGGTLLNGTRIAEPTPLRNGDKIQLGNCVLIFGERRREEAPAVAAASAG